MKRILPYLCVFLLCLSVFGCRSVTPDYFAYRAPEFSAELSGEIGGVAFVARIETRTEDGGQIRSVEYLGDGALGGVTVSALPDGNATLTRDGVAIPCSSTAVAGLLLPVDVLLTGETLVAVRKEGARTVLTLDEEVTLTLNESMIPCAVSSPRVTFDVGWWESGVK